MPFWNYGELYNEDCLVYNSWLPEPKVEKMTKDSCKYCSNVVKLNNNTLDELSNVSPGDILKFYVMNNQPVVVTDATKDWNPLKVLTMDELSNVGGLLNIVLCFDVFVNHYFEENVIIATCLQMVHIDCR